MRRSVIGALVFILAVFGLRDLSYAMWESLDTANFSAPHGLVGFGTGTLTRARVFVRSDGKIYVQSHSDRIFRLNADGSFDRSYGVNGVANLGDPNFGVSNVVAFCSDGEAVAGSSCTGGWCLRNYTADGILDTAFGTQGVITVPTEPRAIAIQPDKKIVYGSGSTLYRYSVDGSLDTLFGTGGVSSSLSGLSVDRQILFQPNGTIVAVGRCSQTFGLWLHKFDSGGKAIAFGPNGFVGSTSQLPIWGVALYPVTGEIFAGGPTTFGRVFANGTKGSITSFAGQGCSLRDIAVQRDGEVLISSTCSITRFNRDNNRDALFGTNGFISLTDGFLALGPNDELFVWRSDALRKYVRTPFTVTGNVTCPSSLYQGQGGECTAQVTLPRGNFTLQYQWNVSSGVVSNANVNTPTATVAFLQAGKQTATLTVYLREHPEVATTRVVAVNVLRSVPTIDSLICPGNMAKGQKGQCVAHASAPWGNVQYSWFVSNGQIESQGSTVDVSFNTAGEQTVTLTASIPGVADAVTRTVAITVQDVIPPTLEVTGPRSAMKNQAVSYNARATSLFGPVDISWTINGMPRGSGNALQVTYDAPGSYQVAATAVIRGYTDNPKATATMSLRTLVEVMPKPTVVVDAPRNAEQGVPFKLTARVTSRHGPIISYWTLPDGTTSTAETLTFTPGKENVGDQLFKYTAYVKGHPETRVEVARVVPVKAYQFPTFTLTARQRDTGYVPYFVTFSADANLKGISRPFRYDWDFGDGTKIPNGRRTAAHTYNKIGTYTVTLIVNDGIGNTSTHTATVNVVEPPPLVITSFQVSILDRHNRAPLSILARPAITGSNPTIDRIASFQWTVNGESIGRNSNTFTHRFTEPGTYVVGLTATTKLGRTATNNFSITVNRNQPPQCTIEYVDRPRNKHTKITARCKDPDGRVVKHIWNLGDGVTSERGTVFMRYPVTGTYLVTLTATDDSGATTTVTRNINVKR